MTQAQTETPRSLAEAILKAREQRGWSQWELATAIGTRENNVSNWETGRNRPSLRFYEKMAGLFGWSLPYTPS